MNTSGSPVVRRGQCPLGRLDRQHYCFHGASQLARDPPQALAVPGSRPPAATGEQSAKAV